MSELFGRTVHVSIGKRGEPATLIDGLRIVFKIEKTLEKTPNHSSIEVYNLNEDTRALFEKKGASVRVTAGYGPAVKDLFIGDVAAVTTKRAGADILTSVEAADGLYYYQTREADISFGPGVQTREILDALIEKFGYVKGEIEGVDLNAEYLKGFSVSGKIRDHMDALLAKQRNVSWSVQDGQLQILPKSAGSKKPAILLTPESGLIGSPFKKTVVNVDIAKKKEGKEAESGLSLKSLLNGEYQPGRLVRVEAAFITGNYRIEKVTHAGDTHAATFYSDLETVAV
jgi:hypothetical protein